MVALTVLLTATLVHVHKNLPMTIYSESTYDTVSYNVVDWWLLIGAGLMDVLAFVGLFELFNLAFWWTHVEVSSM